MLDRSSPAGSELTLRAVATGALLGVVFAVGNVYVGLKTGISDNATVTSAHSRTKDLAAVCRNADILVAAVGRPQMVKADWVKPGATVIDVGINRVPAPERGEGKSRLVGDVAFGECAEVAGAITPVPGGVGPMTIAMLMANTVIAAFRRAGLKPPRF